MDSATCNVIYIDRNVRKDQQLTRDSSAANLDSTLGEAGELRSNLALLLDAFGDVHVCATGDACISQLSHFLHSSMVESKPTLVLIDTHHEEQSAVSPSRSRDHSADCGEGEKLDKDECVDEELYGMRLLERIVYETHSRNLSRLVVPIPVITFPLLQSSSVVEAANGESSHRPYASYLSEAADPSNRLLTNRGLLRKCLDSGAVDVLASPLHMKALTTLEVHAYRAHKETIKEQEALMEIKRGRKRSWVGVHDEKPFSYLREAMVSELMKGICRSGSENEAGIGNVKICVSSERKAEIAEAIGSWHFCAHDFSDDQLLVAASLIFKHAFSLAELEQWRISTCQLTTFLVACRAAYNTFVPYHNFRHAIDVLQATFNFLVHIGALPAYPRRPDVDAAPEPTCALAALLRPFEALALLISAIGHDVGHPGVNNGFLVVLNAPLAQLYNDRSVLESFHCAAYSQILRRYWPKVFEDSKMRSLMISSILATDMGLHFDYMSKLGCLQDKLQASNYSTDGWDGRTTETETALACALLIKCADISNVARGYGAALQWMHILCDEFSRQASMESEIGIRSSLIAEPKKDFMSLAKAQLGFMNLFAIPLFRGIADILPAMQYTVDELEGNKALFEQALRDFPDMDEERRRQLQGADLCSSSHHPSARVVVVDSSPGEMRPASDGAPNESARTAGNGVWSDHDRLTGTVDAGGEGRAVELKQKLRGSGATDRSASGPYSGEWASQATIAISGKMPLSPSTQGTSIISQESTERPLSKAQAPAILNIGRDTTHLIPPMPTLELTTSEEDHASANGAVPKPETLLKKKSSRFKMNALNLFRRHKGTNSPSSTGD